MSSIFFRADAHSEIGSGHVTRCLALADQCKSMGINTHFVGLIEDAILLSKIRDHGHQITLFKGGEEIEWIGHLTSKSDWVVLDGYQFGGEDHRRIRASNLKLLIIDDMAHLDFYDADIILNQNFSANSEVYTILGNPKLLMGPKFALLRQDFLTQGHRNGRNSGKRLLVTLGGSDPDGVGFLVLQALKLISAISLEVCFIAGSSNPHIEEMKKEAQRAEKLNHKINFLHYSDDMPSLMASSDFAVIAGGSTTLEVAFMGLPSLILILANNQVDIAAAMSQIGLAKSLGWYTKLEPSLLASSIQNMATNHHLREAMIFNCRKMVDGFGAKRVAEALRGH